MRRNQKKEEERAWEANEIEEVERERVGLEDTRDDKNSGAGAFFSEEVRVSLFYNIVLSHLKSLTNSNWNPYEKNFEHFVKCQFMQIL